MNVRDREILLSSIAAIGSVFLQYYKEDEMASALVLSVRRLAEMTGSIQGMRRIDLLYDTCRNSYNRRDLTGAKQYLYTRELCARNQFF
jgi:hypothetical protein